MILVATLLLAVAVCGVADAQTTTGQDVQSKCKELTAQNPSPSFNGGFCAGFIDGVIGSQLMWEASDKLQKRNHTLSFCLPTEGTNGQYLQVFVNTSTTIQKSCTSQQLFCWLNPYVK